MSGSQDCRNDRIGGLRKVSRPVSVFDTEQLCVKDSDPVRSDPVAKVKHPHPTNRHYVKLNTDDPALQLNLRASLDSVPRSLTILERARGDVRARVSGVHLQFDAWPLIGVLV